MTGTAYIERNKYVALFSSEREALEYEDAILSIGDEFLPWIALQVRNGNADPTSEYWEFLISQVEH